MNRRKLFSFLGALPFIGMFGLSKATAKTEVFGSIDTALGWEVGPNKPAKYRMIEAEVQSIETAPKDGTQIALFGEGNPIPAIGYWETVKGKGAWTFWIHGIDKPTHWAPCKNWWEVDTYYPLRLAKYYSALKGRS